MIVIFQTIATNLKKVSHISFKLDNDRGTNYFNIFYIDG